MGSEVRSETGDNYRAVILKIETLVFGDRSRTNRKTTIIRWLVEHAADPKRRIGQAVDGEFSYPGITDGVNCSGPVRHCSRGTASIDETARAERRIDRTVG